MSNVAISSDEYYVMELKKAGLWFEEDLVKMNIDSSIIEKVSADIAAKYQIIPVEYKVGVHNEHKNEVSEIKLVTANEDTYKNVVQLQQVLNCHLKLQFAEQDNVAIALSHYYDINKSSYRHKNITVDIDITPLKKLIKDMMNDAVKRHASDIHLLPGNEKMQVHFRINGHLIDFSNEYAIESEGNIISAINVIKGFDESGQTDIAKENIENQGSFIFQYGTLLVHVRISTIPLANGYQKVNLRLLPQGKARIMLDELGYLQEDIKFIKTVLKRSSAGMFINSGPTGSGKTTSLYSQLYELLRMVGEPLNIMTIENPVELHVPEFCQVQVREAANEELALTAPKILKTGLRQDPDVFLYGEIRDKHDAEVAIEAASTGHKVFSTTHAKDCVTTIARLLDLGVSKTSLLSQLNMIISQRLIGCLCSHCSQPHQLTEEEKFILTDQEQKILTKGNLRERGDYEAVKNCPHCDYGYVGRVAIAEYVAFNNELRDEFLGEIRFGKIEKILKTQGFKSMWDKGLQMAACGKTDLDELFIVIGKE